MDSGASGRATRLVSPAWSLAYIASMAVVLSQAISLGYLPAPFFYDLGDNFMDLYHTAFWASGSDAYRVWNSIYPPLNFLVLRVLRRGDAYGSDPFIARDADPLLMILFLVSAALFLFVFCSFRLRYPLPGRERVFRATIIFLSLPFLYGIDRGNTIVWCFSLLFLALGYLQREQRVPAAIAMALAINFKPYFVLLVFAFLAERQWRTLVQVTLWTVLIYLITYLVYGSGSPFQILSNVRAFSNQLEYPWMERTYLTFCAGDIPRLDGHSLPLGSILGTRTWDNILLLYRGLFAASLVAWGSCLVGQRWRGFCNTEDALIVMASVIYLLSPSVGVYFIAVILIFIFLKGLDVWRSPSTWLILVACLPIDLPIMRGLELEQVSWMSRSNVAYELTATYGQAIRPALFALFSVAFACELWLRFLKGRTAVLPHQVEETTPPELMASPLQ